MKPHNKTCLKKSLRLLTFDDSVDLSMKYQLLLFLAKITKRNSTQRAKGKNATTSLYVHFFSPLISPRLNTIIGQLEAPPIKHSRCMFFLFFSFVYIFLTRRRLFFSQQSGEHLRLRRHLRRRSNHSLRVQIQSSESSSTRVRSFVNVCSQSTRYTN